MVTYRAVQGLQATQYANRHGWFVERSRQDLDPEIVSPLFETKAEAEAHAKQCNAEELGPHP